MCAKNSVCVCKGGTLTVLENKVLRAVLVYNRREVMENSEVYILKSFVFVRSELDSA